MATKGEILAEIRTEGDQEFQSAMDDSADSVGTLESAADSAQGSTGGLRERMNSLGQSARETGTKLTAGLTTSMLAIGGKATQVASATEEMQSKMGVVFGEQTKDIREWAKAQEEATGQTELAYQEFATSIGDTLKPMGFAQEEATKMSKEITSLGVDLASFNDMDPTEALERLQGGLVGNHENLREFGVMINQQNLGEQLEKQFGKGVQAASEQEKMLARLQLVQEGTSDAQGDAARTAGSFANQMRALKGQLREAGVVIGNILIPMLRPLVSRLNSAAQWFASLGERGQRLIVAMGGVAAALGPVLVALGTLLTLPITGPMVAAAGAVAALGGAFAALGPDVGAIADRYLPPVLSTLRDLQTTAGNAISGVRARLRPLLTLFRKRVPDAIGTLRGAFETVGEILGPVIAKIETELSSIKRLFDIWTEDLRSSWGATWNALAGPVLNATGGIEGAISNLSGSLGPFKTAVIGTVDIVGQQLQTLVGTVGHAVNFVSQILRGDWASAWTTADLFVRNILGNIKVTITKAVRAYGPLFRAGLEAIRRAVQEVRPIISSAIGSALGWVTGEGVGLATTAFSMLSDRALGALQFGQSTIVPKIRAGLEGAWNWARTTGAELGRQAIGVLGDRALEALSFGREQIVPPIQSGFETAWSWVTGEGATQASNALGTLQSRALGALSFGREEIVPRLKSGLDQAWSWARGEGATQASNAVGALKSKALDAIGFTRENVVPRLRTGLDQGWSWIRGEGSASATNAFDVLKRRALDAIAFTREDVVPPISSGLSTAWTWVRESAVPQARSAFDTLASRSTEAFASLGLREKLSSAVGRATAWIREEGVSRFKATFEGLGRDLGPTLLNVLGRVEQAFREGIPRVTAWIQENGPGIIERGFYAIGTGIRATIGAMFVAGGMVYQAFVSGITGIYNWLQSGGSTQIKNGFIRIITSAANYLRNDAWSDLKAAAAFMFEGVMAAARGLYRGLIGNSLIKDMIGDVASYLQNQALTDVKSAMGKLAQAAMDKGEEKLDDFVSWIRNDFDPVGALEDVFSGAGDVLSSSFKGAFNTAIPSSVDLPSYTFKAPDWAGGMSRTIGGASLDLPQLASGGRIAADGLFVGHAGERVLNPAETERVDKGQHPDADASSSSGTGSMARAMARALLDVLAGAEIALDTDKQSIINDAVLTFRDEQRRESKRTN